MFTSMAQKFSRFWGRLAMSLRGSTGHRGPSSSTLYKDPLTGLPSRLGLLSYLDVTLRSRDEPCMLVLVNVARFRMVNLTHGSEAGDRALIQYARRLKRNVPCVDMLARVGGDEFALLVRCAVDSRAQALMVCAVRAAIEQPVGVSSGVPIELGCAVGFVRIEQGSRLTPQAILQKAETALHLARDQGVCDHLAFTEQMENDTHRRYFVETELPGAIANDHLTLYLQSQVDQAGSIRGAECLVRWIHPKAGIISPGEFLPIAEESDLIVKLGAWVMERAFMLQVRLASKGLSLRLSINVSPRQFMRENFVSQVQAALSRTGADPCCMTFEVTEGLAMRGLEKVARTMDELRSLGLSLSLDDFGTGYSSLAYLKRLPIQEVKLDKQFVHDAPNSPVGEAVVRAVMLVASSMGMQVVAEGVETAEQRAFLSGLGPFIQQGFFYARPLPSEDWLHRMLFPKDAKDPLSQQLRLLALET